MKLPVYTRTGSEAGREVELDDAIFGIEPNDHVIWLDVRSIQAAGRQGTHKTKERGEVAKSRRKLYRQKGTGNARAGDAKSPLRKGGGTIFGPKPHKYSVGVNRKTKQLARRSALAHKLRNDAVRIVENIEMAAPKTSEIATLLSGQSMESKKVLLLTAGRDDVLYRSGRNIPKLTVKDAAQASTLDLMGAAQVLLTEGAVETLTDALRPQGKKTATTAPETSGVETADEA
ncbi:50S ribosomal protein L4 [Rubricoccus marinus]|uniref:Large ribosomal subunit protein uL4 n=1 Tax=Rubricoccus marinus TaxID=716817 RepID=A0A259U127_9BACT|nr:50S ribosomal protein L4 [Rubricoccus marinus]OZC03725.1 50S ribosomal protein L4 [Rubricoccus marinus]